MPDLRPLSAELAAKAELELNENPAEIDRELQSLREWVVTQTYLKSRTSDQFLIVFLRSAKHSVERAKQRLRAFYLHRSRMPDIFKNRSIDCPKFWPIIHSGCMLYLPEPKAPDGPRVAMLRPRYFDMKKHTIPDAFKVASMGLDLLLYEDDNGLIAGYEMIVDLANIPSAVALNFDPIFLKKIVIIANKISPTRMKGFHFLNVPSIFEKCFNMVKSVIAEKLRNRIYVHGSDYTTLYEHIPRHILPKDYGGECDLEVMRKLWVKKFEAHKDFFVEEEDYGVIGDYNDEACRKQCKEENDFNYDEIFGVNGTFRKLNLD